MTTPRYPEWFIGGPWHGEDKRVRAPNLDRSIQVAMQPNFSATDLLHPSPTMDVSFQRVEYVPQRCSVFGQQLTVWVMTDLIQDLNNPYSEASKLLGELIMLPHRDPEQRPDMRGHTDAYRQRWDMEREIRRELEGVYRQRLIDASIASRPANVERYKLGTDVTHGVYLEMVVNDQREIMKFDRITTFFDQGNDEVSPAWVATAQGPGEHSETQPFTGYGTTERAAIVALAADALGIYARMVDLEKGGK